MSDGCAALPQIATALAEDDQGSFDAAAADAAFGTLYRAAHTPAEAVNGATVWRGLELTPNQQAPVEAGLVACEGY